MSTYRIGIRAVDDSDEDPLAIGGASLANRILGGAASIVVNPWHEELPMTHLTLANGLLATLALTACASAPKRHDITQGAVLERVRAHFDNLADIVEKADDPDDAAAGLKAYCEPRAAAITMLYEELYALTEVAYSPEPVDTWRAMNRFHDIMFVRQAWTEDAALVLQLGNCMRTADDEEDTGGDGAPPVQGNDEDTPEVTAWYFIDDANCAGFLKRADACISAWPVPYVEAGLLRLEAYGREVFALSADDDQSRMNARCQELVAITECGAIINELELQAP
jgi:hypothetical protein